MIGWDRADTVLPHLVPTIVYGTREDVLPYMRPFMRGLAGTDLSALAALPVDDGWRDDGTLLRHPAGQRSQGHRSGRVGGDARRRRRRRRARCRRRTVGERMMRYDVAGERDLLDDFGWLDITHGLTYANAARWHHAPQSPSRPTPFAWRCSPRSWPSGPAGTNGTHAVAERDEGRSFGEHP